MNQHTSKGLCPLNCTKGAHLKTALHEGGLRAWLLRWHCRALLRALGKVILCGRDHEDEGAGE